MRARKDLLIRLLVVPPRALAGLYAWPLVVRLDARLHIVFPEAVLCAVLLDVGGTLWPDRLTAHVSIDPCLEQLKQLLPEIGVAGVLAALREQLQHDDGSLVQDTRGLLAAALRTLGVSSRALDVVAVRRALCAPAVPGVRLFPDAAELLAATRRLGLRCVIVRNVQVRGALEYWRDFTDLGIAHLTDAIVTSLDVDFRKPHPIFFQAAIREAGCEPAACVMVGNSEANDIEPAIALGMRAMRVAIEEPPPASSAAHAGKQPGRRAQLRQPVGGSRCMIGAMSREIG